MLAGPETWRWLGGLSLGLAVFGCQPASRAEPPRPPKPGPGEVFWNPEVRLPASERIEAEVSVLGVRAGAFTMEISRPCARSPLDDVEVRAEMSTVGVVRLFKATDGNSLTTMGSARARPTRSELTVMDGDTRRTYRAALAPGGADTIIEKTGNAKKRLREETPHGEHPLDMPSAFVLLRHWHAERGTRGYFYVLLGRHLWRVDVRYRGEVALPDEEDQRTALQIDGNAQRVKPDPSGTLHTRHFAMWLSPDERRVPLEVRGDASFGTVSFVLTRHETSDEPHSDESGDGTPRGLGDSAKAAHDGDCAPAPSQGARARAN